MWYYLISLAITCLLLYQEQFLGQNDLLILDAILNYTFNAVLEHLSLLCTSFIPLSSCFPQITVSLN